MIKISIPVEDLENIVDIVLKYSELSLKKRSVVGIHLKDSSISLQNEVVQIKFLDIFKLVSGDISQVPGFSFDVRTIAKLKYPTKEVVIEFMERSVYITSGKLKVTIRSDYSHEDIFERKVEVFESLTIPNKSLLKAIQKMKLPYAFYKGDPNKSAITIKGSPGAAYFSASDGYSMCRFTTAGEVQGDFLIQLPRITLSSFLNKHLEKEGVTTFEVQDMAVRIRTGSMLLITSQINDVMDDFQAVMDGLGTWSFGSQLKKKEINNAIKSISGSISDKKSVNYITCKIKPEKMCFDLDYSSSKLGGISYTDILFESLNMIEAANIFTIKLHAKSFEDFTALLDENFQWWANKKAVYYNEVNEVGTVEYLYPTVNI